MNGMDLGKWTEAAGDFFERLAAKAAELGAVLNEKTGPLADNILAPIPEEKRRPVLFCLGGMVFLLICLILIMLVRSPGGDAKDAGELVEAAFSPEELFFPSEPDFVPPMLLEREPRQFWTVDDVRLFWKDPGSLGRERWRKEMEAVIDKLLEDIP
jgi:hypothetical protein